MAKRLRRRAPALRSAGGPAAKPSTGVGDWTLVPLWLLVLVVPLVVSPSSQNSFRLPKLLVASVLVAASFAALAWRLRRIDRVEVRSILRRPSVVASALLLVASGLGLLTSAHRVFVGQAIGYFGLALVALVAWESALEVAEIRRLLAGLMVPGGVLAIVGILQHHDFLQPFSLVAAKGSRLALTSLAGGPFDLATFLVLPILLVQGLLASQASWRRRWILVALLALMLYAMALTQTLSALVATGAGSLILWGQLVGRRRLVAFASVATVLGATLIATVPPLRTRLVAKAEILRGGDVNQFLTGRLDGWRTGLWMVEQRPLFGVGQGAYRAHFAEARLALVASGVQFYRRQQQPFFENPHSDLLAAAVNWGLVGVALLVAALGLLAQSSLRAWRAWRKEGYLGRVEAATMSALLLAMLLQTTAAFPLHLAMVAYPFVLVPAAMFRRGREAVEAMP